MSEVLDDVHTASGSQGSVRFSLPVIQAVPNPERRLLVHVVRLVLFLLLLWLIRDQHHVYQVRQADRDAETVVVDRVLAFFPEAVSIANWRAGQPGRNVLDEGGEVLGYLVQTAPGSDSIIGYSGPTNTLIAFTPDGHLVGIDVLSSGDTEEHVRDVLRDDAFMNALKGSTWEEVADAEDLDAVSGATLTSLAISEGIRRRLGGTRPSQRFPEPVTLDALTNAFPTAHKLEARPQFPRITDVIDRNGLRLGAIVRTSPVADRMNGYQGPTDTLIILDETDRVKGLLIRNSYDNEPYVGYVRDDWYFPTIFNGKTLTELAAFDTEAAGVEGVSGATMTSVAVAATLPKAAQHALTQTQDGRRAMTFRVRDAGTIGIVVLAFLLAFTRLKRLRLVRWAFQVLLVIYLGFINGDLVSQTLLVGWARSGVPFDQACGLTILTLAALVIPMVSKKQLYCTHLCPFGAAQQLVRHRSRWQISLPRWLRRSLQAIPAILLGVVIATAMAHLNINLASIEPFDAFLFHIAGWASIGIAIVGLLSALFVPMAYCRFGCPTGAMLNFLRYHARSDQISMRDLVAIALLLFAIGMRVL